MKVVDLVRRYNLKRLPPKKAFKYSLLNFKSMINNPNFYYIQQQIIFNHNLLK
jgi:hypothetical protein